MEASVAPAAGMRMAHFSPLHSQIHIEVSGLMMGANSASLLIREGGERRREEGEEGGEEVGGGGEGDKTRQGIIKSGDKVTFISSKTFKSIYINMLVTIPITTI